MIWSSSVERGAHAGGDCLLADVEVEEARELRRLGELAGSFFEQSDAHHASVHVHLQLGGEFHVGPVWSDECGQRLRIVTPLMPGAPYTWV